MHVVRQAPTRNSYADTFDITTQQHLFAVRKQTCLSGHKMHSVQGQVWHNQGQRP